MKYGWPTLLALGNAISMASTFSIFATMAFTAMNVDFGLLVFASALGSVAHQVSDKGFSTLAVREIHKGIDSAEVFGWLIRSRLRNFAWIIPTVLCLLALIGMSYQIALYAIVFSLLNSFYSLLVAMFQAKLAWGKVLILNITNAAGFFLATFLYYIQGTYNLSRMLAFLALAWLPVTFLGFLLLTKRVTLRWGYKLEIDDRRNFPVTLYSNLVTINALQLIVAPSLPSLVGLYAKAQQPSLLFSPISLAISSWLLPQLSGQDRTQVLTALLKHVRLAILFIPVSFLIGLGIGPLVVQFFGEASGLSLAVTLLMTMSGMGVVSTVLSTGFLAMRLSHVPTRLAVLQACLTFLSVFTALLTSSLISVVWVEFAVRSCGLIYLFFKFAAILRGELK